MGVAGCVMLWECLSMNKHLSEGDSCHYPLAPPSAGCVTVVCSDKTGTLTENELTATEVYSTSGQHAVVRGGEGSGQRAVVKGGRGRGQCGVVDGRG